MGEIDPSRILARTNYPHHYPESGNVLRGYMKSQRIGTSGEPLARKKRWSPTQEQKAQMLSEYRRRDGRVTSEGIREIALMVKTTEERIRNWYANHRNELSRFELSPVNQNHLSGSSESETNVSNGETSEEERSSRSDRSDGAQEDYRGMMIDPLPWRDDLREDLGDLFNGLMEEGKKMDFSDEMMYVSRECVSPWKGVEMMGWWEVGRVDGGEERRGCSWIRLISRRLSIFCLRIILWF
ncbi:hypothetical protein BLNAU_7797 [Blattamonas nauphoetae]|uniref:Homeobox domain-containing protein n=1 Tax=Blattamonas nauphoetae TaxID=2049346 RepID=A0ABQ9Y0F6_9EUKA|nr:hypothetical protein BLNAU_7797 [Blattamonas nauphoetae]